LIWLRHAFAVDLIKAVATISRGRIDWPGAAMGGRILILEKSLKNPIGRTVATLIGLIVVFVSPAAGADPAVPNMQPVNSHGLPTASSPPQRLPSPAAIDGASIPSPIRIASRREPDVAATAAAQLRALSAATQSGEMGDSSLTTAPTAAGAARTGLPTGCTQGWSADEINTFAAVNATSQPALRILANTPSGSHHRPLRIAQATDLAAEPQQLPRPVERLPAPEPSREPDLNDADLLLPRRTPSRSEKNDDLLVEDDLLSGDAMDDGDDPLGSLDPLGTSAGQTTPHRSLDSESRGGSTLASKEKVDPHIELFLKDHYPSAQTCAKCHPKHYEEWRFSSHAYASVSPMFQRFEQAMQDLTRGTVGSFCVRCHAPVATQLQVPPSVTILDAPQVIREGITCVACHRVNEAYGFTHGDRRIAAGNDYAPIYGSSDGQGIHAAASQAKELKLKLSPDEQGPGQPLHAHGGFFAQLSKSDFCASCHQVAVHPGIALEIVHAQFRAGPAHARGITCQDCHMGAVPGKAEGYEFDHCAIINDKPFGSPRRHANHSFWGPNFSIAHPGVFPHNKDANRYTPRQWLAFEYRAGWGTPEFEQTVVPGQAFPHPWDTKDDRIDGRKIIDANLQKLSEKRGIATLTLSAGGKVEGPSFADAAPTTLKPLKFTYKVTNISDGHNLPTGSLGAQPQLWLNAVLVGPDGRRIWESGYLDSNGDLADLNSVDVAQHRLPRDSQLFNLQTKFLVNNIRGTDREAPVPLNFSLDQLVFLRPGAVPVSVLNHPPLIRMENRSIPPLDHRLVHYRVPGELMTQAGQYRLSVRLRSRPEPPYFMRLVGASPEMIRRLNENIIDFASSSTTFTVCSH